MSATVNVGTLEGLLRWHADDAELNKSLDEVAKKADVSRKELNRYNKEIDHITAAYQRTVAAIDPVTSATKKYEQAEKSLTAALKAGVTDQKEYNRLLDLAKEKYLSASTAQKAFAKSLDSFGSDISRVGTSLSIGISAPLAIIGGLVTNSGRAFETSFAGVRKTIDGTTEELNQLSQGLRNLAAGPDPIPIDVNKLNEVAESAGQLGIARDKVLSFTRTMADLGETTNLTALQASESIAQFQNVFGEAGKDVDRFGSTLVALGNAGASTEKAILEMGVRIAGAGKQLNLTQGQVLAIASSLSSVGIEAEAGGSAISKVMISMALAVENGGSALSNFASVAGKSSDEFKSAFQTDAAQALESFISGLGRIKESGGSALSVLDQMGITEVRMRDALLRAAGAGDLLRENLVLQAEAWRDNNALTEEAKKRYETFDSQLQITKNKLNDVGITFGTALLPVLRDFIDLTIPIISGLSSVAKAFSSLPDPIKQIVVGMGALAIATGPVLLVSGQLIQSYSSILMIAPKVSSTFPMMGKAITALLGPWGLLAAAIGVATLALSAFISKWKDNMQAEIEQMVSDANKLGQAFDRIKGQRGGKVSISESDLQARSNELTEVSDKLLGIQREEKKTLEEISGKYDRMIKKAKDLGNVRQAADLEARKLGKIAALENDQRYNTEKQRLEARKKLIVSELNSVEEITKEIVKDEKDLSNQVNIIGEQEKKRADQLRLISAEREIEFQKLRDLQKLASKGSLDTVTRLKEEQRINDLYEYRLSLLRLTEQFGAAIGKQLADQELSLKKMERKVRIDLQLAAELEPIKIDTKKIFQFVDNSFDQAMARLDAIVAVEQSNTEAFQRTTDEYEAWIEDSAASWVEHFRSLKEISDNEMEAVRLAVERGLLSVSEGERAIATIRASYYSSQVDQWSGFVSTIASSLSELGGSFGQFMAQIVSIAQSVQGVNNTAQSLGGWSTAMGAWGGTIAAFVELYKFADAIIEKHKSEKYGTRGAVATVGGSSASSYFDHDSMVLSRSISNVIKAFEDSLRISADTLGAIEIRVRNDGKMVQAWVKGQYIGTFADVNTAIREAVMTAISDPESSLRGLSDLMRQGLEDWRSPDMEGLLEGLGYLREISDLSLSPLVIDLHKSFIHFNTLRDALNKLDQSSEAVTNAQKELTAAQNLLYQQTKAQLMGINLTASKAIQDLAGFQKGMEAVGDTARAGLESSIRAAQNQLKLLEQAEGKVNERPTGVGGAGSGTEEGGISDGIARLFSDVVETIDDEKSRLQKAIADWTEQLEDVPKALTEKEIDLGIFTAVEEDIRKLPQYAGLVVEMEKERIRYQYEQLRLQLVSIGAWERWAGIWEDLYNSAMQNAGKPINVGGGSRSGDKEGVKDFIEDKTFELSLVGLTDYQKSLAELDRQYDDLIRQAGNDKKLKAELLALKERELALLEKEKKLKTVANFQEFVNPSNQFDKVRKTAADLVKEIEDSPFGDARKARMIGRVMEELDNQLTNLSKQAAIGLFGNMLSDMEKFGATEDQMRAARETAAVLEHEMRLANYALTIAELEAEGRLTEAQMAKFHEMYNFLAGIDPTKFIVNSPLPPTANDNYSSYSSSSESESLPDVLSRIQDKLAEWARVPLSETLGRAHELSDSFSELMEDVNKLIPFGWNYTAIAQQAYQKMIRAFVNDTLDEFETSGNELEDTLRGIGERFTDINAAFVHLGATQEELERAERARLSAIQQALASYLDPINERLRSRQVGERSILTGEQQYQNAQRQFRDLFAQIQSGDLSNLGDVVGLADQYEELIRSFTGGEGLRFGLKEIDDALSAITTLVPGFAAEMAEIGTTENPMITDNQGMIDAIESNEETVNTGNTLLLAELRNGIVEMRAQTGRLAAIEEALSNPLSVRDVA